MMCHCLCLSCVATLLVLIDAGRRRAPVFLPVAPLTTDTSQWSRGAETWRLTLADWRAGDIVTRVSAVDIDEPTLPVSYHVIHDTPTSQVFDVTQQSGVIRLTSNTSLLTSLLRDIRRVNVTVQAAITDGSGDTLTANTVLTFELVDNEWSVGGLAWECLHQQASVMENAARDTSVATLRAYSTYINTVSIIKYYIVSGDPQHVFSIDTYTVSRQCHAPLVLVLRCNDETTC